MTVVVGDDDVTFQLLQVLKTIDMNTKNQLDHRAKYQQVKEFLDKGSYAAVHNLRKYLM